MRVMIFAAGGDIGGGKTHILSNCKKLSESYDLKLVSFRKSALSREAEAIGIKTSVADASKGFLFALKFAFREFSSFKPDFVHCHGPKANVIGALLKIFKKAHVISTVHSDPKLDYMGLPFKRFTNGVANRWALRCMDFLIAVSKSMKDLLIERHFDPCSVYVIYNGIDFSEEDAQKKATKDESIVKVGIAARLNPVKDIETALKAFALAYKKDGRLRLSIAGTGGEEEKLRALAKELGIEDVTVFEGWVSDMKAYFDGVDINVLSSISETFPYSLLEGARSRVPVAASRVGGIPSLVEHGKTGFLFEPGDFKALAGYIEKLSKSAYLREKMGKALYEKAKKEYSLKALAETQKEIYASVLRRISNKKKRSGALLCGAYGRGNAGDEAILGAVLAELRSIDPDMPIWVMSRSPEETSKKEGVRSFHIFNVFKMFKALGKAALFVSGGGTLIQDITSSRSLYFYLFTLLSAKFFGCPVHMYGCGIGPLRYKGDRWAAGKVLNCSADIITVRDSGSLELLEKMGVKRPETILAADPTVNLPLLSEEEVDAVMEKEGIPLGVSMAAFCVRDWPGFKGESSVAKAADYVYERYGVMPLFIPFEVPKDIAITKRVKSMAKHGGYLLSKSYGVGEYIGMLSRMKFVCGMRLHSLIFSVAGGTPVIGISYDMKVDNFLRDIGSSAVIPLSNLSFESLKNEIDAVFQGPGSGEDARSRLRSLEKENVKAAKRLLEKA